MRNLAVLLVISLCLSQAQADPRLWDHNGVPVRQGTYVNWERTVAQNADGYSLVVWSDCRTGERDIYAQMISPDGVALWDSGGASVVSERHVQQHPVVTAVNGGWIVAWVDQRSRADSSDQYYQMMGDLYAQKLDNSGNKLWSDNAYTGVRLENLDSWTDQISVFIADDHSGGALVAWLDRALDDASWGRLYYQHVNDAGQIAWSEPLAISDSSAAYYWGLFGVPDGSGNMLVAWAAFETYGAALVRCAKITPAGELPWGPLGVTCDSTLGVNLVQMCADGTGGCYLAWDVYDSDEGPDRTLIKRFDASGQDVWAPDSLYLGPSVTRLQSLVSTRTNGSADGCIVIWGDVGSGENGPLTAQKVDLDGNPEWGLGGRPFAGGGSPTGAIVALSTDEGGAVVAWSGRADGLSGISAQKINRDGSSGWYPGDPFYMVLSGPSNPGMTLSNSGVYLFATGMDSASATRLAYQKVHPIYGSRGFAEQSGRTLISGDDGSVTPPQVVAMDRGRTAVLWYLYRGMADQRIFYQVVDSLGRPDLTANGVPLTPQATRPYQSSFAECTDGSGGFFCAFIDYRQQTEILRIVRRTGTGDLLGGPDGELVYDDAHESFYFRLVPDANGGCYLAWTSYGTTGREALVMRMNSQCQRMWPAPLSVAPYGSGPGNYVNGLATTSDGCCIVTWLGPDRDSMFVARVCDDAVEWTTWLAKTSLSDYLAPQIAADDSGGAFITWRQILGQNRNGTNLEQVDRTGHLRWSRGHLFGGLAVDWRSIDLLSDGAGGAYLSFVNMDENPLTLWAQRLNATGIPQWPGSGMLVGTNAADWTLPQVCDVVGGNLFAAWFVSVNGRSQIRGRYLDANGSVWGDWWQPEDGGIISDTTVLPYKVVPAMAAVGGRNMSVAWLAWDYDNASAGDIRMQQVALDVLGKSPEPETNLPTEFVLRQNYPNPFNPVTQIAFALPRAERVKIRVFDILGREVATLMDGRAEAGNHTVSFDATNLSSGVYIYRLESASFRASRKMVVLK